MPVTTKNKSTMPAADMQWRARKIALQASKLAEQATPLTRKAAASARYGAGEAAKWARPRVGRLRAWAAARAARGSVAVQETVAPKVSSMLAATARRLDPPPARSRRWPKVVAGTALLVAGAAAATAMAARRNPRPMGTRPRQRTPSERSDVLNPSAEAERARSQADVNGLSRTRSSR